ncbi:hypothetical protein Z043_118419 [Scleropages formosus]|uniref:Ig-like domain-containing protein n=1 Tax=Scleropages formosus TaxID=113540 RepID=A0A0P7WPM3_SCLFO|nr:hypothetical protein Z043_118419 [Scleropages formosus]
MEDGVSDHSSPNAHSGAQRNPYLKAALSPEFWHPICSHRDVHSTRPPDCAGMSEDGDVIHVGDSLSLMTLAADHFLTRATTSPLVKLLLLVVQWPAKGWGVTPGLRAPTRIATRLQPTVQRETTRSLGNMSRYDSKREPEIRGSTAQEAGPPQVSRPVEERQMARLGQMVRLPCPVEGDPPPLVLWVKDGRNVNRGWGHYRVLKNGLKIKHVELEDAGVYVCRATNGFGSIALNYTLVVVDRMILSLLLNPALSSCLHSLFVTGNQQLGQDTPLAFMKGGHETKREKKRSSVNPTLDIPSSSLISFSSFYWLSGGTGAWNRVPRRERPPAEQPSYIRFL